MDEERLARRYADLLGPDAGDDLREIVGQLDAAARPARSLEPTASLDEAVEAMAATRRPAVANVTARASDGPPAAGAASPGGGDQPPVAGLEQARGRRWWLRQGLGMVAAVAVLLLVGGVVAAVLHGRGEPGTAGGVGATGSACRNVSRGYSPQHSNLSVAAAQKLIPFTLIVPQPMPRSLFLAGVDLQGPGVDTPGAGPVSVVLRLCNRQDGNELVVLDEGNTPVTVPSPQQIQDAFARSAHLDPTSLPAPSQATVSVTGRLVLKTVIHTSTAGDELVLYSWQQGAVHLDVSGHPSAHLSASDIEAVVAGLVSETPATTPGPSRLTASPSPNASGEYAGLTLAQAQQLVTYYLAQPQWTPSYLMSEGFTAQEQPPGLKGPIPFVTLYDVPAYPGQHDAVQIMEHGGTLHASFPADATPTTLTIVGHTVTREAWTVGVGPMAVFTWQDRGTTFQLTAQLSSPLTEVDVEHMIASMLGQAVTLGPPPRLSISAALASLQTQVTFPLFVPTSVPAGLSADPPSGGGTPTAPIDLRYAAADGTVALDVLEGPVWCCLDADPRKTGVPVTLADGLTAHYLDNEPQFGGPIFWWQQEGTYLAVSGPQMTRDGLVRVATAMTRVTGQSPLPVPTPQPISQVGAVWHAVVSATAGGLVLQPSALPPGIDKVALLSARPGSYQVLYEGNGKQFLIGSWGYNPSECPTGCTQQRVTVRGQAATLQIGDASPSHITLWWSEPVTEPGSGVQPTPGTPYLISADGLTADQILQLARSLVRVGG